MPELGPERFPGDPETWKRLPVEETCDELRIGGWQVMQRWEEPLMRVLAEEVTASHGDVLELGFGMGISARSIAEGGCRSHTIVEAHPQIAESARTWSRTQAGKVCVIEGFWQDVVGELGRRFDAILFDTYPLTEEWRHNHYEFIPIAPKLLRPGGLLTYFSDETVMFRPEHLRLLMEHFDEVRLRKVGGLGPYAHCDYWTSDHMVVPVARTRKAD